MKIAFVLQNFDKNRGGAERYIVELAEFLIARQHELHIFAVTCVDLRDKVHFYPVPVTGKGVMRLRQFSQRSEAMLKKQNFDVIQGFEKTCYMDIFQPHSGVHRSSVVQNLKASPNSAVRHLRTFAKKLSAKERFFNNTEDKVFTQKPIPICVALSEMVKRFMQAYYHVPEDKLRLIYNGTHNDRFNPADRQVVGKRIRAEHGIGDELTFFFVSLNYRRKGLYYLLKAAALLRKKTFRTDFKVLIVGRGNDKHYGKLAEKWGIGEQVIFAGEKKNVHEYYLAGDVLVLPTFYDPCSLVIFEALASGQPVITTSYNGAGEIIGIGQEGWITKNPDDVEELARYMGNYFDNELLARQSVAARTLAEQYPISNSYKKMEELYQEISKAKRESTGKKP